MSYEHKPVGLIPPHPDRKPHPAYGMVARVHMGDGAVMSMADPSSFDEGGLEWVMRYGDPESIRYSVASVLGCFSYLLSGEITQTEAARRLKLMRRAYAQRERGEWPISYAEWRPEAAPTRATSGADLSPGTNPNFTPSHRQGGET